MHAGITHAAAGEEALGPARASLPELPNDLYALNYLANFQRLTGLYTTRDFTFDKDALNAFRGIIRYVRNARLDAYHLCRLPCFTATSNIARPPWTHLLLDSMFWFHRLTTYAPERRPSFPSWSWAGWKRAVESSPMALMSKRSLYDHTNRTWTFLQIHLQDIQLEAQDGSLLPMDTIWEHGSHDEIQKALDTVTVIYFTAPVFSADVFLDMPNFFRTQSINFSWYPLRNELVAKINSSEWSCLLVSYKQSDLAYGDERMAVMLVVQWEEDQVTAERVTLYFACSEYGSFTETPNLERRRVRLV